MTFASERSVCRDCFPTIDPHTAGSEHRVVLPVLLCRVIGPGVKAVFHRDTGERPLLDPAIDFWHFHADALQNSGHDVHGVTILVADFAFGFDAPGPVNDHRAAGAASVRVTLEHFEWSGESHRPAGRVMVVGV